MSVCLSTSVIPTLLHLQSVTSQHLQLLCGGAELRPTSDNERKISIWMIRFNTFLRTMKLATQLFHFLLSLKDNDMLLRRPQWILITTMETRRWISMPQCWSDCLRHLDSLLQPWPLTSGIYSGYQYGLVNTPSQFYQYCSKRSRDIVVIIGLSVRTNQRTTRPTDSPKTLPSATIKNETTVSPTIQ